MNAITWFYGSSFNSAPRTPAVASISTQYVDTRPRVAYLLPDRTEVQIIHDHGEYAHLVCLYTLADGRVVKAIRADAADRADFEVEAVRS